MKKLNKKGFTIVELVIVIAVIAILAAVMIPTFSGLIAKANESAALQTAEAALKNDLILLDAQATNYGKDAYKEYKLTTDKALTDNKTYYTKSGDVYTKVETPNVNDIGTYYEFVSITQGKFEDINAATGTYTYTVKVDDTYTLTFANGEWTW